jgi:hypothetical protein
VYEKFLRADIYSIEAAMNKSGLYLEVDVTVPLPIYPRALSGVWQIMVGVMLIMREPLDMVRKAGLEVNTARRFFLGIFHQIEAAPGSS